MKQITEIEKQISKALELLGYDLHSSTVTVEACAYQRYKVLLNGENFGVWDCDRSTFVD